MSQIKMVKLTKFSIVSDWVEGKPTNTEVRSDIWVNPEQIQIIQMHPYFVPGPEKDSNIDKVMITFGMETDIIVDESMEEVLKIVQGRI